MNPFRILLDPLSADDFFCGKNGGPVLRVKVLLHAEQVVVLDSEKRTAVAGFERGFARGHLGKWMFGHFRGNRAVVNEF